MKLYHPSNKKFDIVKVGYFGQNFYTKGDLRTSDLKRSFWYFTPNIPERRFEDCPYIYEIDIDGNDLYDLREDKRNMISKYNNIDMLLKDLKNRYLGVIYNIGRYDIVAIFYDMKSIRIIEKG